MNIQNRREWDRILQIALSLQERSEGDLNLKLCYDPVTTAIDIFSRDSTDYREAVLSLLEDLDKALGGGVEPRMRAFHELAKHAVLYFPDNTYTIPHPVEPREILNPLKILIDYVISKMAGLPGEVEWE